MTTASTFLLCTLLSGLLIFSQQDTFAWNEVEDSGTLENELLVEDFGGKWKLSRYQPRHVHIAYGDEPTTQMIITWSTLDNPKGTIVEFGRKHLAERTAKGNVTEFTDEGALHLKQYIHRVVITGLTPGETYLYHVGSDESSLVSHHTLFTLKRS